MMILSIGNFILRKPLLWAILLLKTASLLYGNYENLVSYTQQVYSQAKLTGLCNSGTLTREQAQSITDLIAHALSVTQKAHKKLIVSRATPVPGCAIKLLQILRTIYEK
jgi:hypothetical protein